MVSGTITAGTSWIIIDGLKYHMHTPDIAVLDGNVNAFKIADERMGCLCVGIPASVRHKPEAHHGMRWKTECLWTDQYSEFGAFRVTLLKPCEYIVAEVDAPNQ